MSTQIKRRQEKLRNIASQPQTYDDDRVKIHNLLETQDYLFWSTRLIVLGGFFFLKNKGAFDKRSKFLWKEAGALLAGASVIAGGDLIASELVWKISQPIVHRYSSLLVGVNEARERKRREKTAKVDSVWGENERDSFEEDRVNHKK